MIDPKKDPQRRCMPIEKWPQRDREAWERAILPIDPFSDGEGGAAAHWRPETRKKVASSYGRFLTFLNLNGLLDPEASPGDRVALDTLKSFVEELGEQVASVTLAGRITDLREAIRVMAPGRVPPWLERAQRAFTARARPSRNKRARMVPSSILFNLGLRLMDEAETNACRRADWRACLYRDGLMIAFLAAAGTRRRNLHGIKIGDQLRKVNGHYRLVFEGTETKNHRPLEVPLPANLKGRIDRYLEVYRPILLKGGHTEAFWVSYLGRPMAHGAMYDKIREATQRELGFAINLHLFRDCLMTSLATQDPSHVRAGAPMLGHNDFQSTERFYNQARTVEAAREYQGEIRRFRRRILNQGRRIKRRSVQ